jgi:Flp pilus assembly protein TadD
MTLENAARPARWHVPREKSASKGNSFMPTLDEMYDQAVALKEQGDLEGAVAKLNEIVVTDPTYALAHSALAVHLQKLGRLDDAIRHAVRVTELEPHDAFSFTQLSVIYQRCGRIQQAEDAMAMARTIQSRH